MNARIADSTIYGSFTYDILKIGITYEALKYAYLVILEISDRLSIDH